MEPRTLLSAVSWTGGGGDNNWDTPANWSTDTLPASTDDVTINIAANVVHSNLVSDSIKSLTSTQPLTLSGGTLSIAGTSTTSGPLTISGGTLTGTGDITVSGLLTLTAGTISGSGEVNASGGMLINPAGGTFVLDGRTLTNGAGQTAIWTGAGSNVQASSGAVFNNQGTFLAQNQGAFTQGSGAGSSFIDAGSFTKSTSSGELDFVGSAFNVSGGSVDVQRGTLGLQGGGTETGAAFSIEPGATLDFAGATPFSLDSGTTFSGAGSLIKDGSTTLTLPGNSPTYTGLTTAKAGTLLVNGSQPGSAVSVNNGSTLGGTGTVGPVTSTGGTVSPGDSPGILNVQGSVTLDPSSAFVAELNGAAPGTGFDQLNVTGTVNLNGSKLTLTIGAGFTPQGGESFSIIRSTAPIVGTFNGLPEDALLVIGGHPFKISYVGGGGHNVVLTVVGPVLAPQFISDNNTTLVAGTAGSFTVIAIGGPTPSLSETGALPSGVTFVDNADGSATLAGKPAAGTGGVYHLLITASNGTVPNASQNFTLTVNEAPVITSAAATAFAIGVDKSFTVTASGFPTSTLSETGALPSGVNFVDNGNGTATLAGKPAAGTAGIYDVTITATNGVGTAVSQNFTLSVSATTQAPAITSASSTNFAAGTAGTFTVTATGLPSPTLTETGALPSGVTFVDNGNGNATLAGTPAAGTSGVYNLIITAANGVGTAVTQNFTLTVNPTSQPPAITSASGTTFAAGKASTFTVSATGLPTPTLTETGALPSGVMFVDNGNGTATFAGIAAASSAGTYHLMITAANGVGSAVTQNFTLNVTIVTPPKVLRLQRFGVRLQPTRIVLTFDEPMNPASAQLTSNYIFRPVIRGRVQMKPRQAIHVASSIYNAATQTVTLRTSKRLSLAQVYQITVNGTAPLGLTNLSGILLDGKGKGLAGTNFVMSFAGKASQKGIAGPS